MSTLEQKIFGEKNENYCSSSEDENDEEIKCNELKCSKEDNSEQFKRNSLEWEGYSVNTGPKGVIKDWQRFKQIESEQRNEREKERLKLFEKLSLNCNTHLDEEKSKQKQQKINQENIDDEFETLLNESDTFLKDYIKKRMEEMIIKKQSEHKFGNLDILSSANDFLNIIENADERVTVICHIFNSNLVICKTMNGCLKCLAEQYPSTRFIAIEATAAGMSKHFIKSGVPALLAYKSGNLIGNFVSLSNEFGEDFFATDVEEFLVDHGLLPDSSLIPDVIKNQAT